MVDYNNLYNFKNTIRHFININSLIFPDDIEMFDISKLAWSAPFKYRVRKSSDSFRTLKIPNVLVFAAAYEKMKNLPYFDNLIMAIYDRWNELFYDFGQSIYRWFH